MLQEIFDKNRDIVINSDIDGFLCGMLLQKYYSCRVVGFSNSWDCVWLSKEYEDTIGEDAVNKPVYIDLYVVNPDVICIEQHIIGYDDKHNAAIKALGTKVNPNIMRHGRTFTGDYFHKYPFGTVHFLIAMMEREGITVELPLLLNSNTLKTLEYNLTIGDILLRADDALFSSLGPYKANAEEWWPWLVEFSNSAKSVFAMTNYVGQQDPGKRFIVKDRTADYFKKEFGCDGIDGAYKYVTDVNGVIFDKILLYRDEISKLMDMPLSLPKNYNIHKGIASTCKYTGNADNLTPDRWRELYSYAFIFGPRSPKNNFSYTINMK